mmetsp:Transcript_17304/g.21274  ORF Transcript_17304/g.21274 Transcript_17304/m.21274 type:complete len:425 (-) Transcript_17304:27-1301(-)
MSLDDVKQDINRSFQVISNHESSNNMDGRDRPKSHNLGDLGRKSTVTMQISVDFQEIEKEWKQMRCYIIINSIRWILLGVILFILSKYKHRTTDDYSNFCCDCYDFAVDTDGLPMNSKIDWSMCIKECGCNGCNNSTMKNGRDTLINETCTDLGIIKPKTFHDRNCNAQISVSTMIAFPKNYLVYGILILTACITYCVLMIIVSQERCRCCGKNDDSIIMVTGQLFIYNLVFANWCLYVLFKVFQYYPTKIDNNAICFVDTVTKAGDTILLVFWYITLGLLGLQWLLCIVQCCVCRCSCFRRFYPKFELIITIFVIITFIGFIGVLIFTNVCIIIILLRGTYNGFDYYQNIRPKIPNSNKWLSIFMIFMVTVSIISSFDIIFWRFCYKYILIYFYQPKIEGLKHKLTKESNLNSNNNLTQSLLL